MDLASAAITATATSSSGISDITSIALTVSRADARAEDISRMARQLLSVLREYPRQASSPALATADHSATGHLLTRGATTTELAALPRTCCEPGHPLLLAEQSCAICLADFTVGDCLMALHCGHQLHQPCLEEWLRLRASCPLCKATLPGAEFDSSHALGVTSSGAQDAEST
ncbi:RING-type domain-containing protein [Haematococcus lacustris]|uniref:RING-type domain-containing protein n=1 Tax=Haematococcus lacustris TaxID=44745 RepID=A0A6A0A399_HAELA|nr:RING-type domain-containing protein [Haematococcus lacustris]